MTEVNPTCFHLSASAIQAFKACPQRFRLAYREGIRSDQDTDSQRVGTHWHALHEVYQNAFKPNDPYTEEAHEAAFDAAIEHLNECYAKVPDHKDSTEWALERQVLLICFIGYLWYYQDDPVEPLCSEVAFDLPLHMPKTGLPLPLSQVIRVGKIDHIVKWQGVVGNVERKSTARGIADDSDYWDKAKKDTQVSMYALAYRDMLEGGLLPDAVTEALDGDVRFGNTIYDVWHKPTIKPTKLSQKDTAEFFDSGTYFDTEFEVEVNYKNPDDVSEGITSILIDGEPAEFELGKSGKPAVRETVEMYGARLLSDIYERPEFYYKRKEIARTDAEIRKFRLELFNIYQAMKNYDRYQCWFENESQCRATFHCQYIPICYGSGADAVCDGETTPNGFKRIFTELTVEGE